MQALAVLVAAAAAPQVSAQINGNPSLGSPGGLFAQALASANAGPDSGAKTQTTSDTLDTLDTPATPARPPCPAAAAVKTSAGTAALSATTASAATAIAAKAAALQHKGSQLPDAKLDPFVNSLDANAGVVFEDELTSTGAADTNKLADSAGDTRPLAVTVDALLNPPLAVPVDVAALILAAPLPPPAEAARPAFVLAPASSTAPSDMAEALDFSMPDGGVMGVDSHEASTARQALGARLANPAAASAADLAPSVSLSDPAKASGLSGQGTRLPDATANTAELASRKTGVANTSLTAGLALLGRANRGPVDALDRSPAAGVSGATAQSESAAVESLPAAAPDTPTLARTLVTSSVLSGTASQSREVAPAQPVMSEGASSELEVDDAPTAPAQRPGAKGAAHEGLVKRRHEGPTAQASAALPHGADGPDKVRNAEATTESFEPAKLNTHLPSAATFTDGSAPGAAFKANLSTPVNGANTAPFETTLRAALGTPEFAPALGMQLSLLARDGISEARLNLHPAEFGPITVQIALDGSFAQVNLSAEHASTRQALEQALPMLASALRDAGLTLSGGGVFQQTPQGQAAAHEQAQRTHSRNTGRSGEREMNGVSNIGTAPGAQHGRIQRGVVDLYA